MTSRGTSTSGLAIVSIRVRAEQFGAAFTALKALGKARSRA
jgi:hypothetical protein